jgi:hypothetical protein
MHAGTGYLGEPDRRNQALQRAAGNSYRVSRNVFRATEIADLDRRSISRFRENNASKLTNSPRDDRVGGEGFMTAHHKAVISSEAARRVLRCAA